MTTEKSIYEKYFLRHLNEDIETNDAQFTGADEAEPMMDAPSPDEAVGNTEEGDAALKGSMSGEAYGDLRNYLSSLPETEGEVTNQQVIDLGNKYADYFSEVKRTIEELQEKQLANVFEDCLNVKFLPLSKALSTMIDELKAGVADKVHEKNVKAAKENGAKI